MKRKLSIFLILALIIFTNLFSFNAGKIFANDNFTIFGNSTGLDSDQENKLVHLENYINQNYLRDVTKEELYTGQLKGMVNSLNDPYSQYLTSEEFDELLEDTSGRFYGIGVYINSQDGYITVVSPIRNTPAEEAGLLPGDKILKVDGVEVSGDSPDQASKLIKGEKGTTITLSIMRESNGTFENYDIEVTRDEINVLTVESEIIEDNILYISISQFNENTYEEFMEATEKIDDNTSGIILDLRSNPGGLLSVCTQIADELLPEGLIYYTKTKNGEISDRGESDANFIDLPLVTLINGGSASASEIISGALKDYERTILVGEKTFGKGVVQSINRFSTNDGIKLTISEYFTPNGTSIHEKGIEPDVHVELEDNTQTIGVENIENDNQLQKAIEELNKIIR